MNQEEAEHVRHNVCGRKRKFARSTAMNIEATQPDQREYRCPFCGCHHLGHVPSIEQVQRIADAVRFFGTGFSRETA